MNAWWRGASGEHFWLEITDRHDLGADLHAPQLDDSGKAYWGYALIREIVVGDIVFHYDKRAQSIAAISVAATTAYPDEVVWGAHGTTAQRVGATPYSRPGWRLGLERFMQLSDPVSLEMLRQRKEELREIREDLQARFGSSLYFPLELSSKRPSRPTQSYLTKLPAGLVALFPGLSAAATAATEAVLREQSGAAGIAAAGGGDLGSEYVWASEVEVEASQRDPYDVDPAAVERGNLGHKRTQNALARAVVAAKLVPRSPSPAEPTFDLAWSAPYGLFVAEVKSTTPANEEKQLRLGLGQVLRYRNLLKLRFPGDQVVAVLAAEARPRDDAWLTLCRELQVRLVWPGSFEGLFTPQDG